MPGHSRGAGRRRRFAPLFAGLVVMLLAGVALTDAHRIPAPAVPRAAAIRAAVHDPTTARALAGAGWTRIETESLDRRLERVSFFAGGQIAVDVVVERTIGRGQMEPGARVIAGVNDRIRPVPYGNWVAYEPALLVALGALFVLMTGVTPWRRLRNLDVAAAVSLVISIVLFQHRYVDVSLLAALPGLSYLLLRCGFVALAPRPPRAGGAAAATPLLTAIAPGLDPARRIRWLRALALVMALLYVMVGVGSTGAVDVLYAVMEGATGLIHGVLPYGHMPPGIIHGDTYPILSYALYAPLAALWPVSSIWSSVDPGLAAAVAGALVAALVLYRLLGRTGPRRPPDAEEAGLRAALAWLAFPPLLITVSTGTTDVVLGAMLVLAVALWRRPTVAVGVLTVAGWFKLAPFALLPLALAPLRGRSAVQALAAIALVSAVPLALVLALGGAGGLADMAHAISYQFSRGSKQSIWSVLGIGRWQPVGQAAVLGLAAAGMVKLRAEPALAHDRARMAALMAAVLVGLQLAADYWAFLYLVWVAPLVACSLLSEQPAPSQALVSRAASVAPPAALEPASAR